MIPNSTIQADLIAAMKAYTPLVTALSNADRVKENQYAGRAIAYPGVRLDLGQQRHIADRGPCDHARLDFMVVILSEGDSSLQSDQIAGIVNDLFHGDGMPKRFAGTGWYSYFRSTGLISAFRTGEKTWSAGGQFAGVVYPT